MKGWVYVASMSNTVGVLKIGHTTRDPDGRVQELASDTGAPGVGCVEYAVLVEDPEMVERAIHRHLSHCRDKGEWFKCDVPATVMAIRQCTENLGGEILYEDDRARARAEAELRQAEERARQEEEQQEAAKREAEERARQEEEQQEAAKREAEKRAQAQAAYKKALSKYEREYSDILNPKRGFWDLVSFVFLWSSGGIIIFAILWYEVFDFGIIDDSPYIALFIFILSCGLAVWVGKLITKWEKKSAKKKRPKPEDFGAAYEKVYANGDRYEGGWKGGQPHGHGVYVWANGSKYEGDWKDGKRTGRGTFYFANGLSAKATGARGSCWALAEAGLTDIRGSAIWTATRFDSRTERQPHFENAA